MPNPATQSDTLIDIDSLSSGPEMDGLVAERIMKWYRHEGFWEDKRTINGGNRQTPISLWMPSEDISDVYEMETEIKRQGWHQKYVDALIGILYRENPPDDNLYWAVRHASAFQCCKAALKAEAERR